jgi:hypothetical protein
MPVEGEFKPPTDLSYTSLTKAILESGNMLIMTLSHAQKAKDMSLIKSYVSITYILRWLLSNVLVARLYMSIAGPFLI